LRFFGDEILSAKEHFQFFQKIEIQIMLLEDNLIVSLYRRVSKVCFLLLLRVGGSSDRSPICFNLLQGVVFSLSTAFKIQSLKTFNSE
jgi:hypothetical protein